MADDGRITRRKAVGLGAGAAVSLAAGGIFGYHIINRPRPKNVVFVVCDALRADRLGCYGARREVGGRMQSLTPNVDALAEKGLVFERCLSSSSWTLPSAASYMASRLPFVVGDRYNEGFVPPAAQTVAQILQRSGWETAAVVENPHLCVRNRSGGGNLVAARGFSRYLTDGVSPVDNPLYSQGIGQPKVFAGFPSAQKATERAVTVLSEYVGRRTPFFLYVHYMDTHEPYNPPDRYKADLADAPPVEGVPDYLLYQAIRTEAKKRGDETLREDDMPYYRRARRLYDAAVTYVDEWFGRLVAFLKTSGLWDDTLVIFSSDHGEEFAEHGWIGHSKTLYDECLRVPLVVAGRGVETARQVVTPVRLVDVAPTILTSCGQEVPETMYGRPLDLTGREESTPPCAVAALVRPDSPAPLREKKYAFANPRGQKVIRGEFLGEDEGREPTTELYDLRADPLEQEDLAEQRPEITRIFIENLGRLRSEAASKECAAYTVDEETEEILKSLGYLQ